MKFQKRHARWFRLLGWAFVLVILPLLLCEISLGYINFRWMAHSSGFRHSYQVVARELKHRFSDRKPVAPQGENPFLSIGRPDGPLLHPLLGYSRGQGLYQDGHDYFGFRNKENLYFDTDRDYSLVVVTGGSEALGFTQHTPIAENLEKLLVQRTGKKFRVMNLAMNGYCLPQEIAAYVSLAYHLKPEFVVSHSGYNDLMYALMVPPRFRQLGLHYSKDVFEAWLSLLNLPNDDRNYGAWEVYPGGTDEIVPTVLSLFAKFRKLVEENGGKYFAGVQPVSLARHAKIKPTELAAKGKDLYVRLQQEAPASGLKTFSSFPEKLFVDHAHTSDEASLLIARTYAELIAGTTGG